MAAGIRAIAAALDGLDGIVARSTTGPTADGALYDAAADRYMEFFLLGGLLIHVRLSVPVVLSALLGGFMVSYVSAKGEAAPIKPPRGAMRRAERPVHRRKRERRDRRERTPAEQIRTPDRRAARTRAIVRARRSHGRDQPCTVTHRPTIA